MVTTDYAIATTNKIERYKKKVLDEAYAKIDSYSQLQWKNYYSIKNQKENEDKNNILDIILMPNNS